METENVQMITQLFLENFVEETGDEFENLSLQLFCTRIKTLITVKNYVKRTSHYQRDHE